VVYQPRIFADGTELAAFPVQILSEGISEMSKVSTYNFMTARLILMILSGGNI
jgi:hypothetical protein